MNLPNRLTLARIFLIPLFVTVVSLQVPYGDYLAAAVFILAASTDGLDGYIARKCHLVTRLGMLMDPLADKLLISSALISLVELHRLPGWVAMIIIGREFAITGLRSLMAAEGVVLGASIPGKLKTITQIIAIVGLLLQGTPFSVMRFTPGNLAMWVAIIFTIWSGLDYLNRGWSILKKGGF
ncbi:CDP-diacylglycerol--glycerol-3-phosphate 3-phosphatidyltransferase [Desulfofundulus thermocisternus]|uniref:CDP-diacylglycerol--glycerol-3-phosphate 3-phosphatidyltransferase n=1 Tax=Desulfofundulus thermocisternus TaxID=42471 RepID=UPI0019E16370|nr:CDP-diacylglycerol--glycerol-3-phosphate 3-phosphatidyltransferase [Desulfofundulus thermocisternus]MBE3586283.1 CDP-diacylglycerol--glycerol-3-phosphate 3-phosphatidyltransferase [Thermoanaerobacter sp.]MCS5695777.1 CDP-diacylglycerol--glycerol-3-phosphate 3-phosphatidyltransferase [Desulfofundulus thermocisternus]